MTAFVSNQIGAPSAGFFNKGDTVTDVSGVVYQCTVTGYAGRSSLASGSYAQFVAKLAPDSVQVAASGAVTNTTTETPFDKQYTIPASRLAVGSVIKVRFQGIATATNATDTLAIKAYLGATNAAPPVGGITLLTLAARDVANGDIFVGEVVGVVRTIGATGTFVALSEAPANVNVAGTATNQGNVASSTINTTVDNIVLVSATWSVANAGNSCRLDVLTVEVF